jgi:hypothetical protein
MKLALAFSEASVPEDVWGSRSTAPRTFQLGVDAPGKDPRYPIAEPQSRSGRGGEERKKNALALPAIEPRLLRSATS